jgi:glutamine synthetase
MSFFVGGILAHLPALSAFSSSTNATDEYVAWGTRNHAVPLCRVAPGRWDLRVLDGTANVYLGIAATIAAGLLGLQAGEQDYEERDIGVDPTSLDDAGRREGGVRRRMPRDGRESVEALSSDGGLREILGDSVVREYVETKEAEDRSVEGMGKTEKRMWGVERF